MVLAILLGILVGVIGFVPLFIALRATKMRPQDGQTGSMLKLLLGIVVSFMIMLVASAVFAKVDKASALTFVLAEAIALCIAAIAFGIWFNKSHGPTAKS